MPAEIRRVIRSSGVLWLDVPNEEGLYFTIGNLYYRLLRRDWVVNLSPTFEPCHVHGFGRRSLRRALECTGFIVLSIETFPVGTFRRGSSWLRRAVLTSVETVGARLGAGSLIHVWARTSS